MGCLLMLLLVDLLRVFFLTNELAFNYLGKYCFLAYLGIPSDRRFVWQTSPSVIRSKRVEVTLVLLGSKALQGLVLV